MSNSSANEQLVEELNREMTVGHKLFGESLSAVSVYVLTHKDFLFTTETPNKPIACVHLTWSVETDPKWPMTNIYNSLDEWVSQMKLEHHNFKHLESRFEKESDG